MVGTIGEQCSAESEWKCGAARDLPLDKEGAWDGPAAEASIFEHAGGDDFDPAVARKGFLAYDASAPKLRGFYTDGYKSNYVKLENTIRDWFKRNAVELGPFARCLRANFMSQQQHPQPAHPRLAGQSALWRHEHAPVDPSDSRYGVIPTRPSPLSRQAG